ncbi:MAG TPA: TIGR02587 family membrane protein [Rhodothermales bacterium]|nr:TIGR02587 family membrane protein [Rhodothermales bacterium]
MPSLSKPVITTLQQYGRGLAGGLLFSLPLLYTMEVWWAGSIIDPLHLLFFVVITFALLLAYNYYVGIRQNSSWWDECMDAVEEMGMGLLLSALILWLTSRVTSEMSHVQIASTIIIEAMPVAIGVAVGKVQLGASGSGEGGKKGHRPKSGDRHSGGHQNIGTGPENARDKDRAMGGQFVLALLGATIIASNVAPTEEIVVVGLETSAWKLIVLALMSLAISGTILYYSNFHGSDSIPKPDGWLDVAASIVSMYGAALLVSSFLLWFFHRFEDIPLYLMAAQTVVLAFPAALGAAAGRTLLQV